MEALAVVTNVILLVVVVKVGLWAMVKLFQGIDWLTGEDYGTD